MEKWCDTLNSAVEVQYLLLKTCWVDCMCSDTYYVNKVDNVCSGKKKKLFFYYLNLYFQKKYNKKIIFYFIYFML